MALYLQVVSVHGTVMLDIKEPKIDVGPMVLNHGIIVLNHCTKALNDRTLDKTAMAWIRIVKIHV